MSRSGPTDNLASPGASVGASPTQPSTPGSKPPSIADHVLLGLIAVGGYGEVWLACNAVGTLRAVKIARREAHGSADSFEREFKGLQKFEPVSRSHEGLVDILTLGLLPDGAGFYYVMELADNANVGQASRLPAPEENQGDDCDDTFENLWNAEWEAHICRLALSRVKQQVSGRQFQLFDLHVRQNLSVQETARALQASVASVYMAKHRVARLMKKEVRKLQRRA